MIDDAYIQKLQSYLFNKTGKHYLSRVKSTPKDYMVSCPFHKDGMERKPSCGIKKFTDDKGYEGTVHCFSCGHTTNIIGMLKEVLGNLYDEVEAQSLFGVYTMQLQTSNILPNMFTIPEKPKYISKSILKKYVGYCDYLKQRNINEQTATKYMLGYDSVNKHLIFPIRNVNGKCLALGRRSVEQKQYIYPLEFKKPVYGVYELPQHIISLFVVESPFNLWSLSQWGKNVVALLGTGTETQYEQLAKIQCENYVLTLDPDEGGIKGTYRLGTYLSEYKKPIYVCIMPQGKDVNDLTYEQFCTVQVVPFKVWLNIFKDKILV